MKKATIAAVLTASALVLTACSGGTSTNPESGGDDATTTKLSIGNFLDVTSWDPALADIGFDGPYLSAIYDPLLTIDGDGQPQPALATDWEVSEDFKTITMNLRTDTTFSNGEAFDSAVAVKSLDYLKAGVRSQEAFQKVESFEAVDADTIAIHLTQRDDTILYFMGLGRSYMMAPEAIDAGSLAETPVGSGPYTLSDSSVAGAEYHFDKVADHWAAEQFPFDPLTVTPLSDGTAMLNGMEGGQFNLIYGDKTGMDMAPQYDWNVSSGLSMWVGLQFSDRVGATEMGKPLGDVRVRQALNYAFNGQEMVDTIGQGVGVATNQVFPAGTPGYVESLNGTYKPSMDKAKALLAEAGYADGFDITMPMAPPFQPWQAIIEQNFGELGIGVTFKETDFMQYMSVAPEYPMFVAVIAMDGNPVATVERQIAKPQWYNPNPGLESFPEIQAQVDTVFSAEPGDAQTAEIEKLNTMVTEQAFFSVWSQSTNTYISTSEFTVTPVIGMMFPTLRQIEFTG
ncbi:ABC transporter substrate-binding protein [Microterricola viridarii]|uniref:Peptide/nickel transport system substrate-binding protein n=1 Tax=Microterricola viridarii TaxID=412690 RepID=A0A1H1YWG7_9MICO|nr:ABC transporter substrate-binding protein [Microterricola viridarii]SDT25771.1 peptide/nickel transport system substrate-binding protein [Microterricola viridarii]